ncbi:hypothetical protein L211DRAFT_838541 [Terfezia boudieri ATCC MYA-4762]|uniref:Uncharacterized protein n=1 Tax=Terfezia boudieri ATCC MYA-4762 TaxID=1051890 RepID=A0A3N4LPE6_9PEZI|nr:hypothetical protein L211DRAFT_838541 [Terfezia boudieri ATCC MYA-4762]
MAFPIPRVSGLMISEGFEVLLEMSCYAGFEVLLEMSCNAGSNELSRRSYKK